VDHPVPTALLHTHSHPCLERDSNPRSQYLDRRRQLTPQTARPTRWAKIIIIIIIIIISIIIMAYFSDAGLSVSAVSLQNKLVVEVTANFGG
jgi:hypothetical protein